MRDERADGGAQLVPAAGLPGLRPAREAKLLTQQELATASGVSRLTITELETGARNARPTTIRRLAAALEVTGQELLRTAHPVRHPLRRRRTGEPPAERTQERSA
jgi:transcriptional regulator with XRE-family HTH domain